MKHAEVRIRRSSGRDLTSMSAGAAALALISLLCWSPLAPAFADGGTGGNAHHGIPPNLVGIGGAGGADGLAGAPGTSAAAGTASGGGGGGGGGAGSAPGGQGGLGDTSGSASGGNGGAGGAGGANGLSVPFIQNVAPIVGGTGLTGGSGGNTSGGPGPDGGGGGGGGSGGHALVVTGAVASSNGSTLTGGTGGTGGSGGNASASGGGGGGGGGGGAGLKLEGPGAVFTNTGTIQGGLGGVGGVGGNGPTGGNGGDGGSGGVGVLGAGVPAELINNGFIQGGNGSVGGAAGSGAIAIAGTAGTGGAGIVGADLTVINSGTIAGGISGAGGIRANAITFTGGSNILELQAGSTIIGNVAGTGSDTLRLGGVGSASFDVSTIGSAGQYQGFATFVKTGTGTWTLTNTTMAVTPWTINQGMLAISTEANLGAASSALTFNGGTLQYTGAGSLVLSPTRAITLNSGGGTFDVANGGPFDILSISSAVGGSGGLTKIGIGTLVLNGTNTYGGATIINAGTLEVGNGNAIPDTSAVTVASGATLGIANDETIGSLAGAGKVLSPIAAGQVILTSGADNSSTTFSGTISNGASLNLTLGLTKIGTGTFTLSGANTYTGPTTVNGGTLAVNGSIISSTTVNAGGTLGGNGTVGDTTINADGTLSPGNSIGLLTVQGNLVFASAASYLVEVSPTNADRTNVTGTATLGGATVNANFVAGTYVAKQYTVVNATGGVKGTFNGPVNTNLPSGFKSSLSYDADNVFLNLALDFTPTPTPNFGGGLSGNQRAVGNTLVNFFNTTGGIPMAYGTLTPVGLTQASGELATSSQQTTFDAMNLFMGLLTDPFMNRTGGAGAMPGAPGYADEGDASAYAAARKTDAFAMFTKAPPMPFVPRWSVWAAGFGGSQSTSGNAVVGSNDTTSSVYGTAVGADYQFSPNTIAGFAIAGGGTSFSVAGSGSGRSDLFQAGAYVRHTEGAAYVSAALAYGWQDITTNRTVTAAGVDQLRAEFNANAYSGRLEGGYRFVAPWIGGVGIRPYAAGQFTTFELPGYAERVISGLSTFALTYGGKSLTDTRSELGLRTDKSFPVLDGILTLRTRFAWAHDYDPSRSAAATFQALPGASFVVNGAAQASDSALTTASLAMNWRNGWSAAATFEGEFSNVTSSYAGKGVVRYQW
ncbi:autotransporter domain-containing protein [Bradyrhizobium sp. AUGA SZCCT0051]|nr:autotransporter domain-containing protein [Bradyrhizobium sp. AUGA SZCCT0124]MBR1313680.1 autotransporter domain-containing protein [Bradyrhizobium sp. AUGA SZCCT0051]MBR1343223.1 autotransporter domain-containing protein [Bradyrhizobium sp. AUGA SZCCT0105]MBR1357357.1 autotransporter domain-containing protein [Bradyrhizobium sp. AUGA SZCCT0045]